MKLIGFDGQPEGKQAIKDSKIYADPIQYPDRIGRETVRVILKYFEGETVAPEILIPTELYRQADGAKDPTLRWVITASLMLDPANCCPSDGTP